MKHKLSVSHKNTPSTPTCYIICT